MPEPQGPPTSGPHPGTTASPFPPLPVLQPPPGDPNPGGVRPAWTAWQSRKVIDKSALLGGDIPLRPLGISELMDASITGMRRNPRVVLGMSTTIAAVIHILAALAQYFVIGDQSRNGHTPAALLRALGGQWMIATISWIVTAYAVLILSGLLGPVLGRTILGLPADSRRCWQEARAAMPRVLGVATVVLVWSLAALALPCLPMVLLLVGNGPVGLILLSGVLGAPAGFIFMVWVYVTFVLAGPAVALERVSFGQAFTRARRLVSGRWWRAFGAMLLTLLITGFLWVILLIPEVILGGLTGSLTGSALLVTAVVVLFGIFSTAVTAPFDAGVITLLYIDLRMRREGLDLDVQTREVDVDGDLLDLWTPR